MSHNKPDVGFIFQITDKVLWNVFKKNEIGDVLLPFVEGMSPGGDGKTPKDENEWLTKIIKVLNDTYGIDLKEEDKVDFEKMKQNIYSNDELMSYFNAQNSKDNIQDKFNEEIDTELLNFINNKLELYNKLSDDRVNQMFKRLWFNDIYDRRVRGIGG